jgi:P2 family phage major capsid protein
MRNETRVLYRAYLERIAKLNAIADATEKFAVAPSVQQTLERRMQETSEFLKTINMILVLDQEGEKIGVGATGPIAGTTNTAAQDRQTTDISALDSNKYRCEQTNWDSHVPYARLDAWARHPEFETFLRDAFIVRQALDRIMCGFNGTSRAATSNKAANPLLQDVNKGWLQHYREQAPERVMHEVAAGSNLIKIGAGEKYKNIDALVVDLVNQMVDPWHQERTDLVAVVGRELLDDKYFPLVNQTQAPTETLAADIVISQKRVGGLPAVRVPFFPAGKVFVTPLKNLSIYTQEGSRRRTVTDNPKRDRIENYESANDAYVVEDFGAGAVAENITLV